VATLTPARTRQPNRPINRAPRRRLPFPIGLYQTAVGKKWVMAITGLMLLGFVVVHMIGNLHMYEGPAEFNEYGEALRDLGGQLIPRTWALWALRFGLIGAFALHIHAAATLTLMNKRARPVGYQAPRSYVAANYASRSMRYTGVVILLYLVFHLADLTWGWILGDDYIRGDVYNNVTRSLGSLPIALIYIVANVALAVHIYHGAWSLFQSLGWNNPKFNNARRAFAQGVAGVILVGNLSFPIMNLVGVVDQDNRTFECHDGSKTCLGEAQS
jgi:succinate dehydrogenase / fumarate reductase cytochrome b subunit